LIASAGSSEQQLTSTFSLFMIQAEDLAERNAARGTLQQLK
jgi:hypothetical protein